MFIFIIFLQMHDRYVSLQWVNSAQEAGNSSCETLRKAPDFVIFQSELDLDVCVGVHKKREKRVG